MATLTFLGAAGSVTGSKFLVECEGQKLLVDCGLFQGAKELRLRNWDTLPVEPDSIPHVVLTHAHIDHSGYLPRLVRDGFRGTVFSNLATKELCHVLLPDSAHLQEEDAQFARKKGFSKHKEPLPLYSSEEAQAALGRMQAVNNSHVFRISPHFSARWLDAGHILGSAMIELTITERGKSFVALFSGDLGRYNQPILNDPTPPPRADYLVCESTYGDREHAADSPHDALASVISRVAGRGGVCVIPAFAVGRTQTLMYVLRQLEDWQRIPSIPVYVDSPMAITATKLYEQHSAEHDLEFVREKNSGREPMIPRRCHFVQSAEESKQLNRVNTPCVIISASGMATGGRVLHHLARRLPDSRNAVLLAGFQAEGTRGRSLLEGARTLRIHGEDVPVNAEVLALHQFSGHAGKSEILRWLSGMPEAPRQTFLVHGEPAAAAALKAEVAVKLGWPASVATYKQTVELRP
ncbi:MAG TPA: MBL fold metallo-hydrolase [Candidatus Nitrosotenuis sp.]|nr:MBL fold metallo-hydrolase [Candidatus Nitrosotenuis sp.]